MPTAPLPVSLKRVAWFLPIFGLFNLFLFSLTEYQPPLAGAPGWLWGSPTSVKFVVQALAIFYAIALAAAAIGAFLGLLLAQSRRVPNEKPDGVTARLHDQPADGFSELADWLLKIIVGAGLTQFPALAQAIKSVANAVKAGGGTTIPSGMLQVIISASIAFFFLWGCAVSYLLTRTYFELLTEANKATETTNGQSGAGLPIPVARPTVSASTTP